MAGRICYLHIGPPKTGSSAIQWFLRENRAALLERGYLVPASGSAPSGNHFALVSHLFGLPQPMRKQRGAEAVTRELAETKAEAVVISCETLNGWLSMRDGRAERFFSSLAELNLEPRIVAFPRNQPQWFNSSYAQVVKSFRLDAPIDAYIRGKTHRVRYSRLIDLAEKHRAGLIARPYLSANARNVVPDFLSAIGLDPAQLPSAQGVRRNESVGPLTIAVARRVLATLGELKVRQAVRCTRILEDHMAGYKDTSYCGLTADLVEHIETECRADNDAFARHTWGKPWNEVYGDPDLTFEPNDYDVAGVPDRMKQVLDQTVAEVAAAAREALQDPLLAVNKRWNQLHG